MYGKNNQIIIEALCDEIKALKLDILVRDSEIKSLKEKLNVNKAAEKEVTNA